MQKLDRSELSKSGVEGILAGDKPVSVVFTKADGSRREMDATRNVRFIPESKMPNGGGQTRVENDNQVRVFDTGLQEWRSFNLDRLLSLDGVEIS
jgi:hypothetical protein